MTGDLKGKSARDQLLARGFCRAEELVASPHSHPYTSTTPHLRAQYNKSVFFCSSSAIGTTLTRLKVILCARGPGETGWVGCMTSFIFLSSASPHFNAHHSLFKWIQQQFEHVLLLGFLGDHPMQRRLLCSQGKAVAFATKSAALFTASGVRLQRRGLEQQLYYSHTTEEQRHHCKAGIIKRTKPNKSCLHW